VFSIEGNHERLILWNISRTCRHKPTKDTNTNAYERPYADTTKIPSLLEAMYTPLSMSYVTQTKLRSSAVLCAYTSNLVSMMEFVNRYVQAPEMTHATNRVLSMTHFNPTFDIQTNKQTNPQVLTVCMYPRGREASRT
jgi:hypothetical protein